MNAIDKTGTPRSAHDLLMDVQWTCENCLARLQYEARRKHVVVAPGGVCGGNPCKGCRLRKYGYGGQV